MTTNTFCLNEIFAQLDDHTQIITANARQARMLYKSYLATSARAFIDQGQIIDYETWLRQSSEQYGAQSVLKHKIISPIVQNFLWQDIAQRYKQESFVSGDIKSLLSSAYKTMIHYGFSAQDLNLQHDENSSAFAHMWQQFDALLEKNHLQTGHYYPKALLAALESSSCKPFAYKKIIRYGFVQSSPLDQAIFTALETKGVCIVDAEQASNAALAPIDAYSCTNPKDQYRQMLAWARVYIEKHPNAQVACVVPNLNQDWSQLQYLAGDMLHPHRVRFSITGGEPLLSQGIVECAFLSLSLQHKTPYKTFKKWFKSPYLEDLGSAQQRLEMLHDLDTFFHDEMPLSSVLAHLQNHHADHSICSLLARLLSHDFPVRTGIHQARTWMDEHFKILQFPNYTRLSSASYQAFMMLADSLDQLFELDFYHTHLDQESFVFKLQLLWQSTMFQVQSPKNVSIRIMGPLEAQCIPFDALYLADFDARNYPLQRDYNPFIPISMQIQHQMPKACAAKEYAIAQATLKNYRQFTKNIVVSYAKDDSSGLMQYPSTLIEGLKFKTAHFYQSAQEDKVEISVLDDDDYGLALHDKLKKGAMKMLQFQSICPFRAYAQVRMGLEPHEQAGYYLPAWLRGSIMHDVLANFFSKITNQESLKQLSQAQKSKLLDGFIQKALKDYGKKHSSLEDFSIQKLEALRLKELLLVWLETELSRSPFSVIATEKKQRFVVGPLEITMRIDRLDRLENGDLLLIDYKSSKKSIASWFAPRPMEMQMLIYAGLMDINGMAYATISPQCTQMQGIAQMDYGIKGIPSSKETSYSGKQSFLEVKDAMREKVESLAEDIQQGRAVVDPNHPHQACTYCHLKRLCRY